MTASLTDKVTRPRASFRVEHNRHLLEFDIGVLPRWRRRGIASGLLAKVAEVARTRERRLLVTSTDAAVPAGESFMRRVGGRPETLDQGDTAVAPKYRNRGLGRWLEAEMLRRVLAERPQVRNIRPNKRTPTRRASPPQ